MSSTFNSHVFSRLLITIDEDTNKPAYVPIEIHVSPDITNGDNYLDKVIVRKVFTPVMLPEYNMLKQVGFGLINYPEVPHLPIIGNPYEIATPLERS